ncbi:hypothetical protein [Desulfothermus sp.]
MPYSANVIRLLEKVEPSTREVLIAVLEEIERQREESVTKKEFNELKDIVFDLAEAQKKTEQRVNELAEAQKRTEQRLNELAEAQQRTEQELKKLIGEHRKTREQLGGLAHTVGYILEDRAYVGLPPLLEKEKNIKLISPLKRDYLEIGPGKYVELNIIGKAKRNGNTIWVVGECKTQLKKRDVDNFLKTISKVKDFIGTEIFPVLVTYQSSPPVQRYVKEKGIDLYFSYQFPI